MLTRLPGGRERAKAAHHWPQHQRLETWVCSTCPHPEAHPRTGVRRSIAPSLLGLRMLHTCLPPLLCGHLFPRPPGPRCSHQPIPLVPHSSHASSYNSLGLETNASYPTSTPAPLLAEQDCCCKCPRVTGASMERLRAARLWRPQSGQRGNWCPPPACEPWQPLRKM